MQTPLHPLEGDVWVAFDRGVRAIKELGLDGPLDRWRRVRDEIHAQVCREGFDLQRSTFTQSYGSPELDASLLKIPLVGFLPASDPRVAGTVDAILLRYSPHAQEAVDGLPGGEGAFLAARSGSSTASPCSAGSPRHARSSSASSHCATTSVSSPSNTTLAQAGSQQLPTSDLTRRTHQQRLPPLHERSKPEPRR